MWKIDCETCGEVLLGQRRMVGLRNTDRGIEVELACHCGAVHHVSTGRPLSAA
jgi:hypothetical protein